MAFPMGHESKESDASMQEFYYLRALTALEKNPKSDLIS
jgi:hypothetical protein